MNLYLIVTFSVALARSPEKPFEEGDRVYCNYDKGNIIKLPGLCGKKRWRVKLDSGETFTAARHMLLRIPAKADTTPSGTPPLSPSEGKILPFSLDASEHCIRIDDPYLRLWLEEPWQLDTMNEHDPTLDLVWQEENVHRGLIMQRFVNFVKCHARLSVQGREYNMVPGDCLRFNTACRKARHDGRARTPFHTDNGIYRGRVIANDYIFLIIKRRTKVDTDRDGSRFCIIKGSNPKSPIGREIDQKYVEETRVYANREDNGLWFEPQDAIMTLFDRNQWHGRTETVEGYEMDVFSMVIKLEPVEE